MGQMMRAGKQPSRTRKAGLVALAILLVLACYAAAVLLANRLAQPSAAEVPLRRQASATAAAPPVLTVMTWNLGYAALGREADFKPDGGTHYIPASTELVARNVAGIAEHIAAEQSDIVALQEVTTASPLNLNAPMLDQLERAIPGYGSAFAADVETRLIPPPFRLEHGAATLSRARPARVHTVPLPLEPDYWLGFIRKQYALLVTRFPVEGSTRQWVIANLQLSAYDDGATRQDQIAAALRFAHAEFDLGNHVVLAGDWNLLLAPSAWPHSTPAHLLDWAKPFPRDLLPYGWTLVHDPAIPTVRQLDRPYQPGQNYTAVIDGFVVSPNVRVQQIRAIDTGFAVSDHQPVVATLRAIE